MRFLLEFVYCCGFPTQHHREVEPAVAAAEEERWLVPATAVTDAPAVHRSRRKKLRKGTAEWKPSLGPISEDSVVTLRDRESPRNATVSSAGKHAVKRSASAGSGRGKIRLRSYSDGYSGSVAMPTIMPTFSPTPFMF